jgi:DNA polymerase elongation subunit (family B)
MQTLNEILYGKDLTERIVSIEIEDDSVVVFQEDISGKIIKHKRPYQSFLLSGNKLDFGFEELSGSLHYKYIKECSQSSQYKNLRKQYKEAWGVLSEIESYLIYSGSTYYKQMLFEDISVLSVDIETIGLLHEDEKKVLIISNVFRKKRKIEKKIFSIDDFTSEEDMIESWCLWVREKDPSIITGYNIYGFDFPYLSQSFEKFNKTINIGRNGSSLWFRNEDFKPEKFKPDNSQYIEFYPSFVYGREIIDCYFLAKKHDVEKNYYDYKLKTVVENEGLVQEGRQFYDATKIKDNWEDLAERKKIKKYCIDDSIDALNLFDLIAPSFFYNAQFIPKPFHEIVNKSTGSQVNNILLRAYINDGHSIPKAHYDIEFSGAISFGNSGIYKNVLKADVESLYPSIIRHYKIYDEIKDPSAYLLKIIDFFTKERLKNKDKAKRLKDKYSSNLEKSQKLIINSIFGMLGTKGLLFNSAEKAALITENGRSILNKSLKWAEENDLIIANADTDSISFCYKDFRFIDEEERISLIESLNSQYPSLINWVNDGYFDAFMVLKAKNYVLLSNGNIKLKGAALRASNKEIGLKEMINELVKFGFGLSNYKNVSEIYMNYIKEIKNITKIERWATQKTMSEKIFKAERALEQKILAAVEDENLSQGEKFLVYYDVDNNLKLVKDYANDHSILKLYGKTFKTIKIFEGLYDISSCVNFELKKNQKILETI